MMYHSQLKLSILFLLFTLSACSDSVNLSEKERNAVSQSFLTEQAALDIYNARTLSITGKIQDSTSLAIANATVNIVDTNTSFTTPANGNFTMTNLPRKNILLEVNAPGFRSEKIPVFMQHPVSTTTITIPTIILNNDSATSARMLFGGDVAFGRRFLDPDETTARDAVPLDNPDALILASNPEPGTRNVIKELRPYYQEADWGVFNFETPVTDSPTTPHPTKDYVFFTLPGSLPAIKWLGVDYVSGGNNHVYDYLETGVIDTINNLNLAGIPFSGAGLNSAQAFAAYRQTIKGSPYSFLSMTSINGRKHEVNYVAEAAKGGAADLSIDADVSVAIQGEINAGQIPIVQYHSGDEYSFEPTSYVQNRIQLAADENVPLVVIHHPHVAQGIGVFDNTYVILGLGNLAFDQARVETMLGVMARVDLTGGSVEDIRLLPVYLESFAPKLITGRLAHDFLRRLGEFSHSYGALLYPYNGQGWVSFTPTDRVAIDRTVTIDVDIPASGSTVVDLRSYLQWGESLYSVKSSRQVMMQAGRDLMQHGDFEDWDKDSDFNEAARWDTNDTSRFICISHAFRDTTALCTVRKSVHNDDTVAAFRNRIRVMGDAQNTPNKNLSLFGYHKADNAGRISIISQYYASFGELEFGEEEVLTHAGGSFNWQVFNRDLNMPADVFSAPDKDARALRIFIHQSPPAAGEGLAVFDELAIIAWEDNIASDQLLQTPHMKDFLKVSGTEGNLKLILKMRKYVPAASQ